MSTLIEKINATLLKLNVDLQLAKAPKEQPADSGATTGQTLPVTTGGTLPNVVISDYIPANGKISYSAIGAPVLEIIGEDEEEPAEDGIYNLVTKKTITVKSGKLVSEEDTPETGDTKTAMSKVEAPIEMQANKADQLMATLSKAGVDLKKKGSYCINVEVGEDGTITYGTLQTNTYENLLMSKEEEYSAEIDKLTSAIDTRMAAEKEKYDKLVETHIHGVVPSKLPSVGGNGETKMSKTEILKAQIASKVQAE